GPAARYGPDPSAWTGLRGSLALETLAAYHDHPLYPTARGRAGLTPELLRGHAPEFHPSFPLRWVAVPRESLVVSGPLPPWWPSLAELGRPDRSHDHLALPVHPLSATGGRLPGTAVLVDRPYLEVVPTLSMRTLARTDDPAQQLK